MDSEYTQRLLKIEAELERWLPKNLSENSQIHELAEQIFAGTGEKVKAQSIVFLLEPLKELLYRGGKRWRPLLMTLICESFGSGDAALPLAPVIEFSHNASLIHDDIEDDSDERRGKPAIHKIYGIDTAINSGAFFYFLASCCIEAYEQNSKGQIYKLWTECLRRLHLGQAMDINWHRNISFIPSIDEYFFMCRLKTGSLARLASELGTFAAGLNTDILSSAADKIGVGFQILDDVKNLTTGIPGKKCGDDIAEGKKSLPVILYLNKFPENKDSVFRCFQAAKNKGVNAPETQELIEIFNTSGVIKEAEEKGLSLLKEAQDIFYSCKNLNIPVNESGWTSLNGFIKLIS